MRLVSRSYYIIIGLLSLTIAGGCGSPGVQDETQTATPNHDEWQIFGRIATPGYQKGELIAVGMDGSRYRTEIEGNSTFGMELPGNSSYAVYFFPSSGLKKPNIIAASEVANGALGPDLGQDGWALLHFEDSPEFGMRDTLRLPKVIVDHQLNFGEIDIKGNHAFPTINPAGTLDFDGDGIADSIDPDDQNDGLNDSDQKLELERVEICHYTSNERGAQELIPLSLLFTHLNHGDTVGSCRPVKWPRRAPADDTPAPSTMPTANLPETMAPTKPMEPESPMKNPSVVIEETPDDEEPGDVMSNEGTAKGSKKVKDGDDAQEDSEDDEQGDHKDDVDEDDNKTDDREKDALDDNDKESDHKEKKNKKKKKRDKKDKNNDSKKRKKDKKSDSEEDTSI